MQVLTRLVPEVKDRVLGLARQLATAQDTEKPNKDDRDAVEGFRDQLSVVLGQVTGLPEPSTLGVDLNTGDVYRLAVEEKAKGESRKRE